MSKVTDLLEQVRTMRAEVATLLGRDAVEVFVVGIDEGDSEGPDWVHVHPHMGWSPPDPDPEPQDALPPDPPPVPQPATAGAFQAPPAPVLEPPPREWDRHVSVNRPGQPYRR